MKKHPDLSRRKFLKGGVSVMGAGALAAGVGAGSLLVPSTAHAAPPTLPLPSDDGAGNPILDVDLVRKLGWKHYFNGG
jgi:hypothetical protein